MVSWQPHSVFAGATILRYVKLCRLILTWFLWWIVSMPDHEIVTLFLVDANTKYRWISLIQGMLGGNYESKVIKSNMKQNSVSFLIYFQIWEPASKKKTYYFGKIRQETCFSNKTLDTPSDFLSAIWLPHFQLWVIIKGTVSLTAFCVCNLKITNSFAANQGL